MSDFVEIMSDFACLIYLTGIYPVCRTALTVNLDAYSYIADVVAQERCCINHTSSNRLHGTFLEGFV
jgi:hypothetical protein